MEGEEGGGTKSPSINLVSIFGLGLCNSQYFAADPSIEARVGPDRVPIGAPCTLIKFRCLENGMEVR